MWTEERLNELLTTPSKELTQEIKKIKGDILVLGAGGKIGPTICVKAMRAIKESGICKKVIAVSRFTDPVTKEYLKENNVEMISCDMQDIEQLRGLPDVENVIYLTGRKFGTVGQEWKTWGVNAALSTHVAEKYKKSNIVVFSSGNIYPIVPLASGGCTEETPVAPVGEYAQSCLARERIFDYYSNQFGTRVFTYRLNYAVDLRYGVIYDIAKKLMEQVPISITSPCFNCIWQGDAAEIAIRGLLRAGSPSVIRNVTGPEIVSVKYVAEKLGELLDKKPLFEGEEANNAYISNAAKAMEEFGYPSVSVETMITWQAQWINAGGRTLNKPTHFEERKGGY